MNMKLKRVSFHQSFIAYYRVLFLMKRIEISLFTSDKEEEKKRHGIRDSKQTIQNQVSTSLKEEEN